MGISVDVSEVVAFGREVAAREAVLAPLLTAVVVKAGADCTALAQALAPVDTGFLRSSIHADMTGGGLSPEVEVSVDAEYAIYQEFGTSKMAAHPFMIPAHQSTEGAFVAACEAIELF